MITTFTHTAVAPGAGIASDWNVLVTAQPQPGAVTELLHGLRKFGVFGLTPYACVCVGYVPDPSAFVEALLEAEQAARPWTRRLSRVVPVLRQFDFVPESLKGKLQLAAASIAESIPGGTFSVRAELRGLGDDVQQPDLEDLVARALTSLGDVRGKSFLRAFDDTDYVIAVEIVGETCGVGVLSRDMRSRYPFVRVR